MSKRATLKYTRKRSWRKWRITLILVVVFLTVLFFCGDRSLTIFFGESKPVSVKAEAFDKEHKNPWISQKCNRNASMYIMPDSKTTRLLPQTFCRIPITLLVIIFSMPGHFRRRMAIRQTWGSYKNISKRTMRAYFFLGQTHHPKMQSKLKAEFRTYGDIIQEQFLDVKYNGSIKSLMMLKVVNYFCVAKIEYLVKTRDNVYVNIPQLIENLPEDGRNIFMGYIQATQTPIRDFTHRRYVPTELFPASVYPDYLAEPTYVMTSNVVPKVYNASIYSSVFFIEDIYITGILPKSIHLEPIGHEMFTRVENLMEPCILNSVVNFIHNLSIPNMRLMHMWLLSGYYKKSRCMFVPDADASTYYFGASVSIEFLD